MAVNAPQSEWKLVAAAFALQLDLHADTRYLVIEES
jgi:hypothetical protein